MLFDTTVAAISTGLVPAAIGLIRISGDNAIGIAARVFRPRRKGLDINKAEHSTAIVGEVIDPVTGIKADDAVLTVFYGPRSFTGEDMAELSCHGGVQVLSDVLSCVISAGAVQAGPGEFSKRAFLNGKMDLTGAEAIIDVIYARSSYARRAASEQVGGALKRKISSIRAGLITLGADILSELEYPEEGLEAESAERVRERVAQAEAEVNRLIGTFHTGAAVKDGVDTAIVGRPNAGKSSLLNLLSGFDRAIVSSIPGTTRDVISERVVVGRIILNLSDTAGIRDADDEIERIGTKRAEETADRSAMIIAVFDGSSPLTDEDRRVIEMSAGEDSIAVINKADLPQKIDAEYIKSKYKQVVNISCADGRGTRELKERIEELCFDLPEGCEPGEMIMRRRHFESMTRAHECLKRALEGLEGGFTPDVVTVDIGEAADCLGEVTGETATQEMIDDIFSRFCVGK